MEQSRHEKRGAGIASHATKLTSVILAVDLSQTQKASLPVRLASFRILCPSKHFGSFTGFHFLRSFAGWWTCHNALCTNSRSQIRPTSCARLSNLWFVEARYPSFNNTGHQRGSTPKNAQSAVLAVPLPPLVSSAMRNQAFWLQDVLRKARQFWPLSLFFRGFVGSSWLFHSSWDQIVLNLS